MHAAPQHCVLIGASHDHGSSVWRKGLADSGGAHATQQEGLISVWCNSLTRAQSIKSPSPVLAPLPERQTSITIRKQSLGETLAGLQELVMYGLKGMCAYYHHAEALGFSDKVYCLLLR